MNYNLRELERRAFRSTFQDGLWDIYLGLVLIAFGGTPLIRNAISEAASIAGYSALLVIAMMILIVGKRWITVPRLGYVRFGEARQRKISRARLTLMGSVVSGLFVFGLMFSQSLGLTGFSIIFAGNILIIFGALAYLLDFGRLMIYAILCALSMPIGVALENNGFLSDAPLVFMLTGVIALGMGLTLLQRFLHEYHLPPEDATHG